MKNFYKKNQSQDGNALIIVMVLFVSISLSIGLGLTVPVVRANKIATNNLESKRAYFIAESGAEDVYYRLKNGMDVSNTEILTLGSQTSTITTNDASGGRKEVEAIGNSNERYRTLDLDIAKGEGFSFNYAVHSGRGGIVMGGGSQIKGNVYSNGNISGAGSITASAVAANSASLVKDQSNETPTTPTNEIIFGNSSSTQDFAQSFQVSSNIVSLNKISFYIKKTGAPSDVTVRVVKDSGGSPGTENMLSTQGTLSSSNVTTSFAWVDVVFSSNPTLYTGQTYWIVLDNSVDNSTKYYTIGANDGGYASGLAKSGSYNGSWSAVSPSTLDSYFQLYTGGLLGTIDGIGIGSNGVGDAWAHTITNSTVVGTKYCQVGTNCNTSRADPTQIPYPVSDGDIEEWKNEASAGGTITGDYLVTSDASLGPKKITGDLTVRGNNVDLTLTGIVWVQGNILVDNNAIIKIHSSYGSDDTVIVSDKKIKIDNNGSFEGSGTTGSYVMAITTSDCPISSYCAGEYAIRVNNNAGAVVLNAQKGTIHLNNNTELAEATGETLSLGNNAVITYVTGLVDMFFSTGPTGSWDINSWKEN